MLDVKPARFTQQPYRELERHLQGLEYPANSEAIVRCAKINDAPLALMQVLDKLAEFSYHSLSDISKEVERIRSA